MWRARAGERTVIKAGPGVADEGEGLQLLASIPGAPPVPAVLLRRDDVLVTAWIHETARRSPAHEEVLGRSLARLHDFPWPAWGGGSSWIGDCRVDPVRTDTLVGFYRSRLADLARRSGLEAAVGAVIERLDELVPPGPPSLLHGDLWWGNVLWGADGQAHLIDPSVHGGHAEEDLAMLALFGSVPPRLIGAYLEGHPLPDGWEDRVRLWQLYPLLVHTVVFGGGYRGQALEAARRYASPG
jgi:fructosamine-3-kinase